MIANGIIARRAARTTTGGTIAAMAAAAAAVASSSRVDDVVDDVIDAGFPRPSPPLPRHRPSAAVDPRRPSCLCEAASASASASASATSTATTSADDAIDGHHHRQHHHRQQRRLNIQRSRTMRILSTKAVRTRSLSDAYVVDWSDGPVGIGAFGRVYAATNRRSGERVALKRIPKSLASTA
ncbi:hypothetical protein ACHAW5_003497 [Stephanodiscus triporus]|uniref:Protein kinase domain-containing protein n=1 Tax=Stephanodiscus triporus TaxID=2934178 RepID=A0ABD3NI92_9STRA